MKWKNEQKVLGKPLGVSPERKTLNHWHQTKEKIFQNKSISNKTIKYLRESKISIKITSETSLTIW